jgi:hypothetical protein
MSAAAGITQETLDLLKVIRDQQTIEKSWTTGTGLVNYDLEPAAKILYPVQTPLRNRIPRLKGQGDTATRWKDITAINTGRVAAGVSEGNRNAVIATTVNNRTAAYKGIGLEDNVTFEAQYASEGFDDAKARAVEGLLRSVMIAEEEIIIHGNSGTVALGTPVAPVATLLTAQGALTAQSTVVYVVALTYDGYKRASVAGGVATTIARTNADASSDTINGGSSQISAASNAVTTTGGNLGVSATCTAIKGAYAYAWYIGTNAAGALLHSITTINKQTFLTNPTGTQAANNAGLAADHSGDALVFDGITTLAFNGAGYWKSLDGATLTADGAGGIVEIDNALKSFWDTSKVSPNYMLVSAQEAKNITLGVLKGNANPIYFQTTMGAAGQGNIQGGSLVTSYLNKFAMGGAINLTIMLHPHMAPGMIIFGCDTIPYPLANIPGPLRVKARQEYYQTEWPLKSRKYEYGVYADELLQMYTSFAFGAIGNIADGIA